MNSRNKGQGGEREVVNLLNAALGLNLRRNVAQTQEGGADIVRIPGFSIEVKRQEVLKVSAWWTQTLRQAKEGTIPVLIYRQNRHPWRVRMLASVQVRGVVLNEAAIEISFEDFTAVLERYLKKEDEKS